MKTKITLVAILAVTAGAFLWTRPHSGVPSDLRDAVADSAIGQLGRDVSEVAIPEPRPFVQPDTALIPGSGLEIFRALSVEKERTAEAVKTMTGLDKNDPRVYRIRDLHVDVGSRVYAWIGVTKIRLSGNASISSQSECKYLAETLRMNDLLNSHIAEATGYRPVESLFKDKSDVALCGTWLKQGTLEAGLKELQRVYKDANSQDQDKIFASLDSIRFMPMY